MDGSCVFTANSDECDDGNACTTESNCQDGVCVGIKSLDCNYGNACTDDACTLDWAVHTPTINLFAVMTTPVPWVMYAKAVPVRLALARCPVTTVMCARMMPVRAGLGVHLPRIVRPVMMATRVASMMHVLMGGARLPRVLNVTMETPAPTTPAMRSQDASVISIRLHAPMVICAL